MSEPIARDSVRFDAAPDYHELNAGAHRNPPRVLTAPALAWHLAFWTCDDPDEPKPDKSGPAAATGSEQNLQEAKGAAVKNSVDAFILALCRTLEQNGDVSGLQLHPRVGNARLLFNNRCGVDSFSLLPEEEPLESTRQKDVFLSTSRSVGVQFVWKKLDVAIRFEIHTEYCSISTFVELDSRHNKAFDKPAEYSDVGELNANILVALGFLHGRKTPTGTTRRDDATADTVNRYFFRKFWEDFEAEFFLAPVRDSSDGKIFKRVFADFRGLILSEQAIEFAQYKEVFEQKKQLSWGQEAKVAFLPFIQHREPNSRYECTISYLLDGRALYMSTLGPQSPSMPDDQRIPVEFIIYTHHRFPGRWNRQEGETTKTVVNKWQLGRLVSQLLLLGTLRLCALKDVKLLHNAGRELAGLDEIMQRARETIAASEDKASEPTRASHEADQKVIPDARIDSAAGLAARRLGAETDTDGSTEPGSSGPAEAGALDGAEEGRPANEDDRNPDDRTVIQHIASAHKKLNQITRNFLDKSASGLLYRIERSRYYVKQFEDNVKLLRIARVEGNQPYDQFIQRRLGSEFDFIDRLGIRFERATRNIVTLDQNYLAITQNALVQRANKIDLETKGIQTEIHIIQEWGEFALLGALVPYYVMHLVALIVNERSPVVPPLTGFFWSASAILAFFRKFGKTRHVVALHITIAALACIALLSAMLFIRVVTTPGASSDAAEHSVQHAPAPAKPDAEPRANAAAVQQLLESQQKLERSATEELGVLRQLLEIQKRILEERASVPKPVLPDGPAAPGAVETQPKPPER